MLLFLIAVWPLSCDWIRNTLFVDCCFNLQTLLCRRAFTQSEEHDVWFGKQTGLLWSLLMVYKLTQLNDALHTLALCLSWNREAFAGKPIRRHILYTHTALYNSHVITEDLQDLQARQVASARFCRLYLGELTPHMPLTSLTLKPAFLLRPPGRYAISFHGDNLLVLWLEFEGQRDRPICMPPQYEKAVRHRSFYVFENEGFFL